MPERELAVSKERNKDKSTLNKLEGKGRAEDSKGDKANIGALGMNMTTMKQLSGSGEEVKKKRGKN